MTRPCTILLAASSSERAASIASAFGNAVQILPVFDGPPTDCAQPDFCFVEWLLPAMSGVEMCRRLRTAPVTADAQIVLVLDEDSIDARARAMRAGADDYMVGPLTAQRLRDRLGRSNGCAHERPLEGPNTSSGLAVNLATYQARWCGKPISLRPNELRLLAAFAQFPDRLLTRSELIGMLGKECGDIDIRTVDVWVGRLRRALREQGMPEVVRTVRSLGYVFDSLVPAQLILNQGAT